MALWAPLLSLLREESTWTRMKLTSGGRWTKMPREPGAHIYPERLSGYARKASWDVWG